MLFRSLVCPRVTGVSLILKHLKPDCVLDMTITYNDYVDHYGTDNGIPFSSSHGLLRGEYPKSTIIDVHDISSEMLSENANVSDIIMSTWRKKDTMIENNLKEKVKFKKHVDKKIYFIFIYNYMG